MGWAMRRPPVRRSGDIARDRLKFLMITDKTGITPELLDMLRNDLCRSISRYMDIAPEDLEVTVESPGRKREPLPVLCTRIPVKNLNFKGTF